MTGLAFDASRICRLQVRAGPTDDALNLRMRLENVLANADFRPTSLPADAILCVRRLPRVVVPVRPLRMQNAMDFLHWQSLVREAMDHCASNAGRPAHGAVSPGADAVLFADVAELLACLSRDWLLGEAVGRWWWRSLFPGRTFGDVVREAWLKETKSVPAAMARLDDEALAADFLNALPTAVPGKMAAIIARMFALESLHEAVAGAVAASSARRSPEAQGDDPARGSRVNGTNDDGKLIHHLPPWSPWVRGESLPAESQVVFVLSMMLHRAPMVARSLKFLGLVREFAAERQARYAGSSLEFASVTFDSERSVTNREKSISRARFPAATVNSEMNSNTEMIAIASPPVADGAEVRSQTSVMRVEHAPKPLWAASRRQSVSPSPAEIEKIICPTEWGGVFYLVNVALALEFYGDFTQPQHPSLPLPVWDFLGLMGRRIIGPEFERDRLWNLLAILSGRTEGEPPGAWFTPGDESREEASTDDSLLDRWVNRTAKLVCNHVDRLLNASEIGRPDIVPRDVVFHHAAQVHVSSERVMVQFSLADHPIELRLATLDRDPGWVPAAGRAIIFQYD